jgi:hypothetical protein
MGVLLLMEQQDKKSKKRLWRRGGRDRTRHEAWGGGKRGRRQR